MSIETVFMQQITSDKTTARFKRSLIEELSNWRDETTPLCSMGVLFDGAMKGEYLRNIEELVRKQVRGKKSDTETLFWMYYLADVLKFILPVTTEAEKTAKDVFSWYLEDPSEDIDEYISIIKLN